MQYKPEYPPLRFLMSSFYHFLHKVPLPHGAGVQIQSLPVYVDLKAVSKNVWMLQTK